MPPVVNKENCIQCGTCVEVCPTDVFFRSEEGKFPQITYPEECQHCSACVDACPEEGAIKLRVPLTQMICYK
jgi:adenylylsulfate reductase subunit B